MKEYRWSKILKVADFITVLNAVFGFMAIYYAINSQFVFSIVLMVCAAIADFFDGKIARLMKQESNLGIQIDSLADIVSFGAAPAVFGIVLLQSNIQIVASVLLVVAGVLRLSRFNIVEFKGFIGMPIPIVPFAVGIYYVSGLNLIFVPYLYILLSILMLSNFKIKK